MEYNFSDIIKNSDPSYAQKMYELMRGEGIIALSGGNPAKEAFPVEAIKEISNKVISEDPISILQYLTTEGYLPLREFICKYLKEKSDLVVTPEEILITSGAQQAIALMSQVICNHGDAVICDSASYVGALNTFKCYGLKTIGAGMDEYGMLPDELDRLASENKNAKIIYLIPNFQNPTGITVPLERRKALYEVAKKHGLIIIEDNPYGELRFGGENVPSMKSFDKEGLVAYSGSFSKVVAPGLRVGYLIADPKIIASTSMIKQFTDVHTTGWSQRVCYEFFNTKDTDAHIKNICALYSKKCNLMLSEMEKHFPKEISWVVPEGGMFVWCTDTTKSIDIWGMVDKLVKEEKVAIVPGDFFAPDPKQLTHSFRMNFTVPSEENIVIAIAKVGKILKEVLG